MTVRTACVRGIWEMAERRRIRREDMQAAMRCAMNIDGEVILNRKMDWMVDGEATEFPMEKVGKRLEVTLQLVVARELGG
jgi:hypothetical protein